MTRTENRRDVVAERWADEEFKTGLDSAHWMASPTVRAYLNWLASGIIDCDWLTYLLSRWVPTRPSRVLVLGCGDGWLERTIAAKPWITRIDAFDVADEAVARAAEAAKSEGIDKIHYGVRDLNVEGIGEGPFDLIIAHSVIHHIENLEFFFDELDKALTADGVIVVNEYVGPKRFQFTDLQLSVENALLTLLPERFRLGHLQPGTWHEKPRPSVEEMIRMDPSEAVRSDEIVAFLEDRFTVLESREYGGTILHDLLYDLVPNFDEEVREERVLLIAMCLAEAALIRRDVLPSDFVVMALAKGPREPLGPELAHRIFSGSDTIEWRPASPLRTFLHRKTRSVLDRPWTRVPHGRRAENLLTSGHVDTDWVEAALAEAGNPNRAIVAGDDVESVSNRLESLGVNVEFAGRARLVIGSRLFSKGAAPIVDLLEPGGVAVSVEAFRADGELPLWSEELATMLVMFLPDEWKQSLSVTRLLKEGVISSERPRNGWASLEKSLATSGLAAECRPMSTLWISRILAMAPLHQVATQEPAAALLSILCWLDGYFASEGLLEPARGLVIAKRSR